MYLLEGGAISIEKIPTLAFHKKLFMKIQN